MAHPISVRALAEYFYRSGDIEQTASLKRNRLAEGTRLHQLVQAGYPRSMEKEVALASEVTYANTTFYVHGRCDGLDRRAALIDEIKSTTNFAAITDGHDVHWGQAKLYGFLVGMDRVTIRLTYIDVVTERTKQLERTFTADELSSFTEQLLAYYAPLAQEMEQHFAKRQAATKEVTFPYDNYRPGQRELAVATFKAIKEQRNVYAMAPTGIGKTLATLFPSIKAIGETYVDKLFYVTPKTLTRTVAEQAVKQLNRCGANVKLVSLTAKEKICFLDEVKCNPVDCPYAAGHFDRINEAVLDIVRHEAEFDRATIERYAKHHTVCPFEFSLDLIEYADVVIGDYNYIFDPRVSLKRLFDEEKRKMALLVDEAHNLVERGRSMYSASLEKSMFSLLAVDEFPRLAEAITAFSRYLMELRRQERFVIKELDEELTMLLDQLIHVFELDVAPHWTPPLLEAYMATLFMRRVAGFYDERYITALDLDQSNIKLTFSCLDPGFLLQQYSGNFRSSVFFSATFMPFRYYKEMIGGSGDDWELVVPSPFQREQLTVQIAPISTRFRDRQKTLPDIVYLLEQFVAARKGHYLLFFPSHHYMEQAARLFHVVEATIIVQEAQMDEAARHDYLAQFEKEHRGSLVGFAVMGGIFSEGIDLVGERLTGVAVVGVGLPQVNDEQNRLKDYFTATGRNGYDYAYVFPGINKVLQAGGRLIRSETDYGSLLLIDDRFLQLPYPTYLPPWWKPWTIIR